jgi:AcrR family transcriptional regulator
MRQMPGPPNRDRIERALVDLCVESTYARVTLGEVLERAGVDEATFEFHYRDLDDCFCSIYREMRDEYMWRIAAAFDGPTDWRGRMRAAAHVTLAYLREDPPRARMTFVEVLYASDRVKLLRDESMQVLFTLVDQGREEPGAPPGLTRQTAETIGSAAYQRIQSAIMHDEPEAFEEGVREMMYMVVLPYLGEEAAREELAMPLGENAG